MTTLATIESHGTITIVRPETREARDWLKENTAEDAQWYAGGLVVEPRYLADLLRGLRDALGPSMDEPKVMT